MVVATKSKIDRGTKRVVPAGTKGEVISCRKAQEGEGLDYLVRFDGQGKWPWSVHQSEVEVVK